LIPRQVSPQKAGAGTLCVLGGPAGPRSADLRPWSRAGDTVKTARRKYGGSFL